MTTPPRTPRMPVRLLRSKSLPVSELQPDTVQQLNGVEPCPGVVAGGTLEDIINTTTSTTTTTVTTTTTTNVTSTTPTNTTSALKRSDPKTATIRLHYYPEGGWGWVICACAMLVEMISHGLHNAYGVFYLELLRKYGKDKVIDAAWLGGVSWAVALLSAPVVVALCRRKSTRLTAVIGGLVVALGCLFSSFASQFHQLFFSFGAVLGVGVGLTTVPANLMIGQYFKRKRELVEIPVHVATGFGVAFVSFLFNASIGSIGWRLGLQAMTGAVFITFFAGVFYRSASLYHPQRRAILHLKNQKRKVKDKAKVDDKPPFFDFTTLKSRTVQILLVSTAISALGINTPFIYLVYHADDEGIDERSLLLLQMFLGLAMAIGCSAFGFIVVRNSTECRVARHYLCQVASFMIGVCTLAFTAVDGYRGYVLFACTYGLFYGGYHYSLKMFTYEKVRARNFARTWAFVQWSQAVPVAIGIPITGYMNFGCCKRSGYYFSAVCAIAGSITLFLVDVHRRNVIRRKHSAKRKVVTSGSEVIAANVDDTERCDGARSPSSSSTITKSSTSNRQRRSSLPDADADDEPLAIITQHRLSELGLNDPRRPELTCISEEGLVDLPDNIFDELDLFGDCMTSCDQVEHYLMLSEYENNLNKTNEIYLINGRRRKSLVRIQEGVREEDSAAGDSISSGALATVPVTTLAAQSAACVCTCPGLSHQLSIG